MKHITTLLFILTLLLSCSDPSANKDDVDISVSGVFITNEGNFVGGVGSLSFYDLETNTVQNDIFKTVNGRDLGNVVQSMTIIDSLGYIVVNGSATIELISLKTWRSKGTITLAGKSPRSLAQVTATKAYVTNLYTADVSIIDLINNAVIGTISVGTNPDAIAVVDGKAYVANHGWGFDSTVSVIDTDNDHLINTITVARNPVGLDVDENGMVHVICSGYTDYNNAANSLDGGIYVIDPASDKIIDSVVISGHPRGGYTNHDGRGFYANDGSLFSYDVNTVSTAPDSLFSGSITNMNLNKVTGKIFIIDAKDYVQAGDLNIYDPSGALQETHNVGIIPGKIIFVYDEN